MTDFTTLRPPAKPNWYLVAPESLTPATPHRISPVLAVSADRLYQALLDMLASAPRTRITSADAGARAIEAVQRTAVLRFPDDISIQVLALDDERATLALYSRARYGYSDFGANRRRAEQWIRNIETLSR